jgi:DNA-binding IclR family transcriptional regulator
MSNDPEQAFARKILEQIVAAGGDGAELQELAAETGRNAEEVEDMVERLQAKGYLLQTSRWGTEH